MRFIWTPVGAAVAASIGLSGCLGDGSDFNVRPSYVGTVSSAEYDGVSNDLLTAGLGKSGLQSAVAPAYANPLQPTATELRRAAIYNSYRALLDIANEQGARLLVTAPPTETAFDPDGFQRLLDARGRLGARHRQGRPCDQG